MSHTIERLRRLSDDELVREHDAAAAHTVVGVTYYLEELRHRDAARSAAASERLARAVFWLTVVNTVLAAAAVVAAVASVT